MILFRTPARNLPVMPPVAGLAIPAWDCGSWGKIMRFQCTITNTISSKKFLTGKPFSRVDAYSELAGRRKGEQCLAACHSSVRGEFPRAYRAFLFHIGVG